VNVRVYDARRDKQPRYDVDEDIDSSQTPQDEYQYIEQHRYFKLVTYAVIDFEDTHWPCIVIKCAPIFVYFSSLRSTGLGDCQINVECNDKCDLSEDR